MEDGEPAPIQRGLGIADVLSARTDGNNTLATDRMRELAGLTPPPVVNLTVNLPPGDDRAHVNRIIGLIEDALRQRERRRY